MQKFQYTGKTLDGQQVTGELSAQDREDLEARLVNRGIFLERHSRSFGRARQLFVKHFKRSEITRITRQMSLLLKSEVTVLEALELARDQINDTLLSQVFCDVSEQIEAGRTVAASMSGYPALFDELYVSMVEAGESSGTLDNTMERIADYREKREEVTSKVRSAMAYPALVVAVAIMVVLALIVYIVPIFSSMYENFGAELPALTQKVILVSDHLRGTVWYWAPLALVAFASVPLAFLSPAVLRGWHRLLMKAPLIGGLITKVVASRFCSTMGSLLTSGVDIIYAMEIASRTTGNSYAHSRLQPARDLLAEGKGFTATVESVGLFPKAMLRLTASGEKTGRLGEMLTRAAEYYEKETDTQISTLTTLIEPVIIILLGVFIAFILVAMYLPLFDLVGAV